MKRESEVWLGVVQLTCAGKLLQSASLCALHAAGGDGAQVQSTNDFEP